MKTTIAVFMLLSVSVGVQAGKVYKCPGKTEGQFVYQQSPCKGAKPDEHTIPIVHFDERKAAEAAKLKEATNAQNNGQQQPVTTGNLETGTPPAPGTPAPVATPPAPLPAGSPPAVVAPPPAVTTTPPATAPATQTNTTTTTTPPATAPKN